MNSDLPLCLGSGRGSCLKSCIRHCLYFKTCLCVYVCHSSWKTREGPETHLSSKTWWGISCLNTHPSAFRFISALIINFPTVLGYRAFLMASLHPSKDSTRVLNCRGRCFCVRGFGNGKKALSFWFVCTKKHFSTLLREPLSCYCWYLLSLFNPFLRWNKHILLKHQRRPCVQSPVQGVCLCRDSQQLKP